MCPIKSMDYQCAATVCCEHKLGMPVLVDSSGTVAPLESLLAMLLSPLWRAMLSFGCGISAMALLEIADLLFQVLNDDQRLSWLGFLLRTFAVGNGHKYELIWLRHRVSESNVGWRPRRQVDRRTGNFLLAQDAVDQFS